MEPGILLAAREPALRFDLKLILSGAGYRIIGAPEDEDHVLIRALIEAPAVIVLAGEFIDLAQTLQEQTGSEIILVIGDLSPALFNRVLALNVAALVRMPLRPVDLISAVEIALSRPPVSLH